MSPSHRLPTSIDWRVGGLSVSWWMRVGLGMLFITGCAETPSTEVTIEVQPPVRPLLVSEVPAIAAGRELESAFLVRNPASEPVEWRYEGAGCTCYHVEWDGHRLQAGESVTIAPQATGAVKIAAALRPAPGEQEFAARFTELRADGSTLARPLSLIVPVFADLIVRPDALTLGYQPGVEPLPVEVQVERVARRRELVETPPQLEGLPAYLTLADWSASEVDEPEPGLWRRRWDSRLKLTPGQGEPREDVARLLVRMGTGDDAPAPVMISLLVMARAGVRGPQSVVFGPISPAAPGMRRVLLSAADLVPFSIVEVRPERADVKVQATSTEPSVRHWLEIEWTPGESGALSGAVLCYTDHPVTPEISFVVRTDAATGPDGASAVRAEPSDAAQAGVDGKQ